MKIIIDEIRKEAILVKKDNTEISRYSYKNLITATYPFEEFKKDMEKFNQTLSTQEEFDNMKDLNRIVTLHTW